MGRPIESRQRIGNRPTLVAILFSLSVATALASAQDVSPTTQLDESQKKEFQTLSGSLRDQTLPAEKRKVFAVLLLDKAWQPADDLLADILAGGSAGERQAVIDALAGDAGRRPARFVAPLVGALDDDSEPLRQSASRAIGRYGDEVVERVRGLLDDSAKPARQRCGLIDALARMRPSNKVIDALVAVLDDKEPEVLARAMNALNNLTFVTINDVDERRRWWQDNRANPELDRVWREVIRLRQENADLAAQHGQLEDRLVRNTRELFVGTPPAQQADLLAKLLADSLPAVRELGLRLVDESVVPPRKIELNDSLRKAVLQRLADPSPRVRLAAADVSPSIGDAKSAIAALLEQEAKETDLPARRRMIRALARASAGESVPRLIGYLRDSADRGLVAESAAALGVLGARTRDIQPTEVEPITAALLDRYTKLNGEQPEIRDALIAAMAGVADARFAPVFLKNLADNSAPLRKDCVTGLGNLAPLPPDKAQLAIEVIQALVARVADPDRGVRQYVIQALARYGPGRIQLDAVYQRTNPNVENDESVRRQAWDRLIEMLKSADKAVQLSWIGQIEQNQDPAAANRLVDLMKAIEPVTVREPWTAADAASFAEKLGDLLMKIRRPAEAAQRYELVYKPLRQAGDDRARAITLKYLQALLDTQQLNPAVAVIKERQAVAANPGGQELADAVLGRLRGLLAANTGGANTVVAWAQELRAQLPELFATGPNAEALNAIAQQARERIAGATTKPE